MSNPDSRWKNWPPPRRLSSRVFPCTRATPVALAAAALSLGALAPAGAHHGVAQYDMQTVMTLEGVVEKWDWKSPHTWLTFTATAEDGSPVRWEIEGAPPGWMERQGWSPESLEAGEPVEVMIHPSKHDPAAGILMEVARANGEVLKVNRPARLGGP